jgi:hypothetical protein
MPSRGSARWLSQIPARGDALASLPTPSAERCGRNIRVIRGGHFPAYLSQQAGEVEVERFTPVAFDDVGSGSRVATSAVCRSQATSRFQFRSSAPLSGPRSGSPVPWCTTQSRRWQ